MTFEERRKTLIGYMRVKIEECDWHGVSDAANDLREIEAEERGRRRETTLPSYSGENLVKGKPFASTSDGWTLLADGTVVRAKNAPPGTDKISLSD